MISFINILVLGYIKTYYILFIIFGLFIIKYYGLLKLGISLVYNILLNYWDSEHVVHIALTTTKDYLDVVNNKCILFYNNLSTQKYIYTIKKCGDYCVMVTKYIALYLFNKFIWGYICDILEPKTNNITNNTNNNVNNDDDLGEYILADSELLKRELSDIQKILHNLDVLEQRNLKKIN